MSEKLLGLIGATSMVGECLSPLLRDWHVVAFSRSCVRQTNENYEWQQFGGNAPQPSLRRRNIGYWICVAPIWVLSQHFNLLEAHGVRRIVVLSSTSRFTKANSSDLGEQSVAQQLVHGEERLRNWAEARGVEWVILRPTLIYGRGRDKNISAIARFIQRFGFFPLIGEAGGLRQPLHADDVATACVAAIMAPGVANQAYNISGGETLTYREMVRRIFVAKGQRIRLLNMPIWSFRLALALTGFLPNLKHLTMAMVERMNNNMVFDHEKAKRDFGFSPKLFKISQEDIPE